MELMQLKGSVKWQRCKPPYLRASVRGFNVWITFTLTKGLFR